MNERKICFIACVNNSKYEQEMLKYLSSLIIPEGYEMEYLSVYDAKSMAAGYNEGMRASEAKYKIYLHQDVFIVNPYFIQDMLDIFKNQKIGMLGMVGSSELPENAIMWNGPRIGKLYCNIVYQSYKSEFGTIDGSYQEVEAVDGLLIATQYDLPWREDLFLHWDFYDISQSQEFIQKGYKVVVPNQIQPWCIHDDGFSNLKNYYQARKIFKDNYFHKDRISSEEQNIQMKDQKITVVLTVYNQKDMLLNCLQWLKKVEEIENLIIVDNGSEDGTAELLPSQGYGYIVFDEGVQGYAKVWNAVIDNFDLEEVVVFMTPRYFPGRKCFKRLAEALEKHDVGIAGPISNGFYHPQYISLNNGEELLDLEEQETDRKNFNMVGVDSGLWAIRKSVLAENGRFDEGLVEAQNVFLDYELRLIQKKYQMLVCPAAVVCDTLCGSKDRSYEELLGTSDREILKQKWRMNYFNLLPHSHLAELIREEKDAVFRVLEVGCDLGATLVEIKNRYPNSRTYGLEINEAAVDVAKYLSEVKGGNIEQKEIPFEEKFDYIIFGDVLEHLHNPQEIIRFCKERLTDQGRIIASIPNLMHISVMQQLLNGRFQYEDTGLLDRSHIHFFTYYQILLMFQEEQYTVEEVKTTSIVLTEEQEELKKKLLEISHNVEMHMYDTFQYIVKAKNNNHSV